MGLRVGVVAVVLLAGCSGRGGSDDEPSTASAPNPSQPSASHSGSTQPSAVPAPISSQEAASAIAAKGMGCTDYAAVVNPEYEAVIQRVDPSLRPNPAPTGFGRCTVGGIDVFFIGFKTPAEAEAYFMKTESSACASDKNKADGVAMVVAGNQTLSLHNGEDAAASERLAAAAGGTLRVIRCP